MKALSLLQPWASLIAVGAKKIETRSWRTNYRGRIAIHASKRFPVSEQLLCEEHLFYLALTRNKLMVEDLPRGAVVATADLYDCVKVESIRVEIDDWEYAFGNYDDGRFAWLLRDVERLAEPIPAKGALGLWNWEDPRV